MPSQLHELETQNSINSLSLLMAGTLSLRIVLNIETTLAIEAEPGGSRPRIPKPIDYAFILAPGSESFEALPAWGIVNLLLRISIRICT